MKVTKKIYFNSLAYTHFNIFASLNDIAKLTNYYFDEKYTRSVMLLSE